MRFSLSPVIVPLAHVDSPPTKGPPGKNDVTWNGYSVKDDDSSSSEEEPPHPLDFGRTRFLAPQDDNDDDDDDDFPWRYPPLQITQLRPCLPISSYDSTTCMSTTKTLLRSELRNGLEQKKTEGEDQVDSMTQMVQAASLVRKDPVLQQSDEVQEEQRKRMASLVQTTRQELEAIRQRADREKRRMQEEHKHASDFLGSLLKREEIEAAKVLRQEQRAEQAREEIERQRLAKEERIQQEKKEKEKRREEEENEKRDKAAKVDAEAQARIEAAKPAEAKKTDYIKKGKHLVAKLVEVRGSIQAFDSSKLVSKRRLNMKKIVRGKVNTLNHEVGKVQSVAAEVSKAIDEARSEDEQIKQAIQAGSAGHYTSELARGKRYLVDLLASNVIVRIQADGFNGTRGDGFPLAAMLAAVSLEQKELIPIQAAHIYTVCPTAMPSLPHVGKNASETDLMKSLGMLQDKNGEFETFDKFLTRTEGLISIVAAMMCSNPSTHALMSGHKGAAEWLRRFLDILPPAPEKPLPLLTAPVLVAFLTAAGHMLANKYSDPFKTQLDSITGDIISRLDEGSVGAPSATRLKKLVEGGFESFKTTLPPGALPELYHGASAGDVGQGSQSFSRQNSALSSTSNPFGGGQSSTSSFQKATTTGSNSGLWQSASVGQSPFGSSISGTSMESSDLMKQSSIGGSRQLSMAISSASSPFEMQTEQSNQNSFDQLATGSSAGSFGTQDNQAGTASFGAFGGQKPFGGGSNGLLGSPAQSGFTGSNPPPFGGSGANTAPFGGSSTVSITSPFGAPGGTNQQQTPFASGSTSTGQQQNAPFGGRVNPNPVFGTSITQQSPFGSASNATQQSPFGASQNTFSTSPFGAGGSFGNTATSTPFGSGSETKTPFGGGDGKSTRNKPPCKFFKEGRCRNGANCRFSHEMPSNQSGSGIGGFGRKQSFGGGSSGYGNNQGFGGGSTGFGGGGSSFGNSSNPFGSARR